MENAEKNFITVLEDGKRNKKNTKALVFLAIASSMILITTLTFIVSALGIIVLPLYLRI